MRGAYVRMKVRWKQQRAYKSPATVLASSCLLSLNVTSGPKTSTTVRPRRRMPWRRRAARGLDPISVKTANSRIGQRMQGRE
jgi:hypothetical protein